MVWNVNIEKWESVSIMADYVDVLVFLVGRVLPLLFHDFPNGAPQFKRNFSPLVRHLDFEGLQNPGDVER